MAALQKGDLVLVTGATGLIGAWVADQSLAAGLKVRVVSRTEKKAKVLSAALKKKYPEGHVEVAIVSDMQVDGAWDEAVKGELDSSATLFLPAVLEIVISIYRRTRCGARRLCSDFRR